MELLAIGEKVSSKGEPVAGTPNCASYIIHVDIVTHCILSNAL